MTEETATLQARLRHGARNIHSIGPVPAAALLDEAAAWLERAEDWAAQLPRYRIAAATTAATVAEVDKLAGAIRESTTAATVAGSAQQQLGKDVAATRAKQLEATEAVRAAKTALETHNATVVASDEATRTHIAQWSQFLADNPAYEKVLWRYLPHVVGFDAPAISEERKDVEQALSLLDELRNTAIPVARLREEMLKPAQRYLKARLVALSS